MSALEAVPDLPKARRGTTNRNDRGSSYSRRRRREWLVETYRADRDVVRVEFEAGFVAYESPVVDIDTWVADVLTVAGVVDAERQRACRCYRCGVLLTVDTVTADRIKPGIEGGTYARTNIRPACGRCNSSTGQALATARKKAKRPTRIRPAQKESL